MDLSADVGAYAWEPTAEHIANANITRLMRRLQIDDYRQLVQRSQADIGWFWDAVVNDLGIAFFKPYYQTVDTSHGVQWPRWFSGSQLNLAHNCVDRHAAVRGRRPAICWEAEDGSVRQITYAELAREVNQVANGLRNLGVRQGDRVAVYLPMVPEAVVAAYAAAKIGAIFVPIFSGFGSVAVAARLNDAGAKVLLTADGFERRGRTVSMKRTADTAVAAAPSVERVVVLRRVSALQLCETERDIEWDDAFRRQSAQCPAAELEAETPFMIAYTSGTTGRPKGAVHVHGGLLVKVAAEVAYQLDIKPDDLLYWVTDMGWIMGSWQMIGAHCAGAAILMYDGAVDYPDPSRLWSMCERHKVSILGLTPTLVRVLAAHGAAAVDKHDLSKVRILGSTGEPWDDTSYRWYADIVGGGRCPIVNMSGGTEVGACFFGQPPVLPTKACSVGVAGLGMAMDVYDSDGKPVRGALGELVCKKPWPSMTRGFWNDPERYIEAYWSRWAGVWVHGDLARVDGNDYWFVTGRSDDTMNIAGKRIGPSEVEAAAAKHPAVAECAAVGIPDEVKGTVIWCFCSLIGSGYAFASLIEEIKQLVASDLGKPFTPAVVKVIPELPKTRSGKVLRRVLRCCILGEPQGDLSTLENPHSLAAIGEALRT